jgi:hypothetical protein
MALGTAGKIGVGAGVAGAVIILPPMIMSGLRNMTGANAGSNYGGAEGFYSGTPPTGPGATGFKDYMNAPVQTAQNWAKTGLYNASGGRIWWGGPSMVDPKVGGLIPDELNIGGKIHYGGRDPEFERGVYEMPGQVIGGTLTNDEKAMINLMDPKDRARYLLQKRIQEKAEMAVLLSQLQALRHQTAMSIINNIR